MEIILTLFAAVLLAMVHIYGVRLTFSPAIPRSHWLSIAGGTAVAYVFLHILPDLHHGQDVIEASNWAAIRYIEQHVYIVALFGLVSFYGLEHAVSVHGDSISTQQQGGEDFWVHVGAFALYNAIIGYLLVHRFMAGNVTLAAFTLAMMLHFIVNDHALREHHQQRYHDTSRWLLAGAVLAGWLAGVLIDMSEAMVSVLFAFIAGAIILNVLKEELPSERESKFWAFALGAIVYSVLLLLVV